MLMIVVVGVGGNFIIMSLVGLLLEWENVCSRPILLGPTICTKYTRWIHKIDNCTDVRSVRVTILVCVCLRYLSFIFLIWSLLVCIRSLMSVVHSGWFICHHGWCFLVHLRAINGNNFVLLFFMRLTIYSYLCDMNSVFICVTNNLSLFKPFFRTC